MRTTTMTRLKSTTMMTIFGSPRARRGTITFAGRDITSLPPHQIARLSIAQSPEGRRIFPRMTVFENLQMGASIDNLQHFDEDLERAFAMFPRLKERAQQRGGCAISHLFFAVALQPIAEVTGRHPDEGNFWE